EAAEALGERDVDRVEQGGDLVVRTAVVRPALPEPRAVEVEGDIAGARPLRLRDELAPLRKHAAELALRQLEDERRHRLVDRGEVSHAQWPVGIAGEHRPKAVEM